MRTIACISLASSLMASTAIAQVQPRLPSDKPAAQPLVPGAKISKSVPLSIAQARLRDKAARSAALPRASKRRGSRRVSGQLRLDRCQVHAAR